MSTTLTPPPVSAPAPTPPPARRSSSRIIAILTIALGAAVVVGTVVSTTASTVAAASVQTSSRTLAVDGVNEIDVELAAGALRIEFADVDEAELVVTSSIGADQWTFERDRDELKVASPSWQFGLGWFGGNGSTVLRLPSSLERLDTSLHLAAGDLTAAGAFGDLDLEVGAGSAEVTGSARELSVDLSAGRADVDIDGATNAELDRKSVV